MNAPSRPYSLLAYDLMIEALRELRPLVEAIEKGDRDLGNQLRRAAASVALNLSEGQGVAGGNRRLRRQTALGSLYETRSCLEVAAALGYVDDARAAIAHTKLHRVGGLIYGLLRS